MFKVGEKVEVVGDPEDPLFVGSLWDATVISVETIARKTEYTVEFEEIYTDETQTSKERETVPASRVRPPCVDDSTTKSVNERQPGDPVDCWDNDLWWEGYVHEVWDDHISIYFPYSKEKPYIIYDPLENYNPMDRRVRTGRAWDPRRKRWGNRPRKLFQGSKNNRSQPTVENKQGSKSAASAGDEQKPSATAVKKESKFDQKDGNIKKPPEQQQQQQQQQQQKQKSSAQPLKKEPKVDKKPPPPPPAAAAQQQQQQQQQQVPAPPLATARKSIPGTSSIPSKDTAAKSPEVSALDGASFPHAPSLQGRDTAPGLPIGYVPLSHLLKGTPFPSNKRKGDDFMSEIKGESSTDEDEDIPIIQRQKMRKPLSPKRLVGTSIIPLSDQSPSPAVVAAAAAAANRLEQQQDDGMEIDDDDDVPLVQILREKKEKLPPSTTKVKAEAQGGGASTLKTKSPAPPVGKGKQTAPTDKEDKEDATKKKQTGLAATPSKAAVTNPSVKNANEAHEEEAGPSKKPTRGLLAGLGSFAIPVQHKTVQLLDQPPPSRGGSLAAASLLKNSATNATTTATTATTAKRKGLEVPPSTYSPVTSPRAQAAAAAAAAGGASFQIPKRPGEQPHYMALGSSGPHGSGLATTTAPPPVGISIGKMRLGTGTGAGTTQRGKVVCLDNIGACVTSQDLFTLLKPKLNKLLRATVACIELDNGQISYAGYAALEFTSPEELQRQLPLLEKLCIKVPGYPVPRPLIAHLPYVPTGLPWGSGPLPGHMRLEHPISPHFAQPNSIEFDLAMDWRLFREVAKSGKEKMCVKQARELADVLMRYKASCASKNKDREVLGKPNHNHKSYNLMALEVPPHLLMLSRSSSSGMGSGSLSGALPVVSSCCLWLKDVAPSTEETRIENVMQQFGFPESTRFIKDPVTKAKTAQALMVMDSSKRACDVATNLKEMIFLLQGTPRPVHAELAVPGPPRGAQSTYDRATRAVFDKYTPQPIEVRKLELIEIADESYNDPGTSPEEKVAIELRCLLRNHAKERQALRERVQQAEAELAKQQIQHYENEKEKLEILKSMNMAPLMKQLLDLHGIGSDKFYKRSAAATLDAP